MQIPLYRHNLHGHDIDALGEEFKKLLRGMILSTGSVAEEIQQQFAAYMQTKHCLLTNNWTNATIAALLSLKIGPGDEVIVPAMTFVASANAVEAVGARPVLVDIDPHTKLMDIDRCLAAVNARTRAVMPVHLYGQMVDVRRLRSLLRPDISIVEDAAHAIESQFDGYKPGAYSDFACFSFYASKNMTTGEGGAMITNDRSLFDEYQTIYRHGIDLCGYRRHIVDKFIPAEAVTRGIKSNMPDILAFLLRPQISSADDTRAKRQAIADRYHNELKGLETISVDSRAVPAWHIYPVAVDADHRHAVLAALYERGIKTTIHFKSLHMMEWYRDRYGYVPDDYPNAYAWGESVFSLPVFPTLTDDEQSYVIESLNDIIAIM